MPSRTILDPIPGLTDEMFSSAQGSLVALDGESFYEIKDSHLLGEFFLYLASSSDHWMFISSSGAVTAGRKDADHALFPYYSVDKVVDFKHCTGPKTVVHVLESEKQKRSTWEPFSSLTPNHDNQICRNLYKNRFGNKFVLEEINTTLGLSFRYRWSFGSRFGFIRHCRLENLDSLPKKIEVLDGIQNILPYGINSDFQLRFSNLADAYKKHELISRSNLGVYYLSSIPTDRAEPSEGLRATTVWHQGIENPKILLSSQQLDKFRLGQPVVPETDIRAGRGAYFVVDRLEVGALEAKHWCLVADVNQDQTAVTNLSEYIAHSANIVADLDEDIAAGEEDLFRIVSSADGTQIGNDAVSVHRHLSNVLFNVMRGGLPLDGYEIHAGQFKKHVFNCNQKVAKRNREFLESLSGSFSVQRLSTALHDHADVDLLRIGLEYLPFGFSRRHGDPTRPWNRFSINMNDQNGSGKLGYEGNWRDIFQNWEALSLAFPLYSTGIVFRFVNASTADGYNAYRLTQNGFDWETPAKEDPWSNIGYWGDHQIIYLLKHLEWTRRFEPTQLDQWLDEEICTFANVPYKIRSYAQIKHNPRESIDFDFELAETIERLVAEHGSDGKLLRDRKGEICRATLAEKIILPALTKITNFVPTGGIWMNTQRPEWNDANNALAGHGLSVVTVCYLRRYFAFLIEWFNSTSNDSFKLSVEVAGLVNRISAILEENIDGVRAQPEQISPEEIKSIVDALSIAGSEYRETLYLAGFSRKKEPFAKSELLEFFEICLEYLDHTIRQNRRDDGLYHSYNLLDIDDKKVEVQTLNTMLEGQVAVLSSGLLDPAESLRLLDALRLSALYREDQNSYMLYPDLELPRFTEKNVISAKGFESSGLLRRLVADGNVAIVTKDVKHVVHFNGDFRNSNDLNHALDEIESNPQLRDLVISDRDYVNRIFEDTFQHREFTGRSSRFFAYEGLGSIYWHMVSKLRLAVIEIVAACKSGSPDIRTHLRTHYDAIVAGIGYKKTPREYGAFPTDPYSHTPRHAGVQQPGMTGQVKEDIIARIFELGIQIQAGEIHFDVSMFDMNEFLRTPAVFEFCDIGGNRQSIELPANSFGFTLCQVPIVYKLAEVPELKIYFEDGETRLNSDIALTKEQSFDLFSRNGRICKIECHFGRA